MLAKFKSIVIQSTINTGAKRNIKKVSDVLIESENPLILNLGSGTRFTGYESFAPDLMTRVINLDIDGGATVSVIADAHNLPFAARSFNGVISQATLEHTQDSSRVVAEIERVLMPKGLVYAEIPFLQGYHPHPTDFRRYTVEGIRYLFKDFNEVSVGVCVGPSSTLVWVLRQYLVGLLSGFSEVSPGVERGLLFVASVLTFPLKYLDLWLADRPKAHIIASGLYYLGEKR